MLEAIVTIASNFGFPVACVVAMGAFIFVIYKNMVKENAKNMAAVQRRCQEREEVLFSELKENREINAKAIETIAHYAEKLDRIQEDIKEIKTDITVIMTKS